MRPSLFLAIAPMSLLLKIIAVVALIALLAGVAKHMKKHAKFALGVATLAMGMVLASMIGTTTELVLPGMTGIVAGGIAGALLGGLVFAVLGGLGVVGGGGFALGLTLWKLVVGGSLIGVFTGTTSLMFGGFGIRTTHFFLVSPFIWGPIILASFGLMRRALQDQPAPANKSKALPGPAPKDR